MYVKKIYILNFLIKISDFISGDDIIITMKENIKEEEDPI